MVRLLGALCAFIGISGAALAADLPVAPPPRVFIPAVVPVYYWTGIYFGINGGWGWGNAEFTADAVKTFPGTTGSRSDNGGVVGGTFGGNVQYGAVVFGLEGDWDYSAINTGTTSSICTFSGNCQTGNNWLATARLRGGYAWDRLLFYATGGVAFANVQTNFAGSTSAHDQVGWTVGTGLEWAFTENWTAKIEYLFVDLGSKSVTCDTGTCLHASGGFAIPVRASLTENLVRVGVNYKFTW